jgi:CDP-glycerol glycerophosphotransferase (TagB/SpsB family)
MRKPVIYYHFDYKKYRETQYSEGYFNYSKNGFGPIVDNIDTLVKEISNSFEQKFTLNEKYSKRNEKFYKYHDKNNCERIYNEIIKLK